MQVASFEEKCMMSVSEDNNMEGVDEDYDIVLAQPRQPKNLQGLLRFAIEATKNEDAPEPSFVQPLDEERRRFLEDAMQSMTVNVAEMLLNTIETLSNKNIIGEIKQGGHIPSEVISKLNVISDFVNDIDVANDFKQLGGFAIFPICLPCEHEEIKSRVSVILGTICQNNPSCQAKAVESGILNLVLYLANAEYKNNKNGTVFAKYIYAISAIVRGYDPAIQRFVEQDGVELLIKALLSNNLTSKSTAAFFINNLFQTQEEVKEFFINQGLLKIITEEIKAGQNRASEHMLAVLQSLLETANPKIIEQYHELEFDLKKVIEDHLSLVKDDVSCMEQKDYCSAILNLIEENSHIDLSVPDDR